MRKAKFALVLAGMLLAIVTTRPVYGQDGAPLDGNPPAQYQNPDQGPGNPQQPPDSQAQAGDDTANPPVTVGRLSGLSGTVTEEPAGVNDWSAATYNSPLSTGDRLYVDQNGRAEIDMSQTIARLWHQTDLTLTNLSDSITQLGLSQGTLRVRTFALDPNHPIEVDTPNGAITVTQPGAFRVDAYPGDGGTLVTVNSGEIEITGPNLSKRVGSGQSVQLTGTNPIQLASMGMPGSDEFDRWSQQRDQSILNTQSRQYVNPDTVGSEDLDQYGSWTNTPDYGPMWYPTTVAPGWVPYSMGQWSWVSPWGWTWIDAEPWGFAPFHYGRWAMWGGRWGWVPGPYSMAPVYSPALVGWVGGAGISMGFGGGVGLSAWFPLGPGEPFYPWYHCGPGYFSRVNITNINVTTINRVTNIQNINNTNYYNYYHQQRVMQNMHFANRTVATSAMRQSAFASGQRITPRTAIHPTAMQIRHTQWIPHPAVAPTLRSVTPHPVSDVPVSSYRPTLFSQNTRPQPGAMATQHPAMTSGIVRPGSQPMLARGQQQHPAMTNSISNGASSSPRPLFARTAPPAQQPTFQQRQPAMQRDPGRPLDPWQVRNIYSGRPAGPARAAEFPPHPQGGFGGGRGFGGGAPRGNFGGGYRP